MDNIWRNSKNHWNCNCKYILHYLTLGFFVLDHILFVLYLDITSCLIFNTLRLRQNGRNFPDNIFKCISLNENVWILIKIVLKFVPKVWINNIPALVQIMAWHCPGNKPLSEPMIVSLPMHICVTRPQWVNKVRYNFRYQNSWSEGIQSNFSSWKLKLESYSDPFNVIMITFIFHDFT